MLVGAAGSWRRRLRRHTRRIDGWSFTGDDPDEARELEKFLWVRVCALGEWQGWRGKGKWEKRRLMGMQCFMQVTKQLCSEQVLGIGPTNSVKNIEWWQVSDGAKHVWYFKVMSDEWQKLSDGNWVMKKASKQALIFYCKMSSYCLFWITISLMDSRILEDVYGLVDAF